MARPERRDADYFPFYAKDGRTLFILESKYQCKGTGFFTNVLRFLTLQQDHHFCIADETDKLYFFSKCHCDLVSGMDMLDIMAKCRKIDAGLWVSSAVIVSQDLLDSLEEAYRKRINKIITIEEIIKKYVSEPVNPITSAGNEVTTGIKPQRKGKEIKEKNKEIYYTEDFLNFYSAYPLKKAKQDAFKMWQKHKPPIDICLKAIKAQKLEKIRIKENKEFCPEWKHPATWINKGCWEDEPSNKPEIEKEYI